MGHPPDALFPRSGKAPRIFSKDWKPDEPEITLGREAAQHLVRVLRLKPGAAVECFNGQGAAASGVLLTAERHAVCLRLEPAVQQPRPRPHITLVQALIRPQPFDWLIRKATELGVSAIQPVYTQHCVARASGRPDRWWKAAVAAAEQCGGNWLPDIRPVQSWDECLSLVPQLDGAWMGALQPPRRPLQEALRDRSSPPGRVGVWVGPEGDFTAAEVDGARAAGIEPVALGNLTLRAETAALYFITALRYEWGQTDA